MRTALVLALIALVSSLPFYSFAQGDVVPIKKSRSAYSVAPDKGSFVLYAGPKGEAVCRQATPIEARAISGTSSRGLIQINHLGKEEKAESTNAGLTIILRATSRLNEPANAHVKQAFIAAAAKWEALIKDSITVAVDVDYGPTFFDDEWDDPLIIGATSSPQFFIEGNYPDVRNRLINRATPSSTEAAIATALPTTTLPTDLGAVDTVLVTSPNLRVLGVLPPDYNNDNPANPITAPKIGFNSAFAFDFDPSDDITGNRTDFDAVAVHEIGHLLGFNSQVGDKELTPADPLRATIWDLFRFRPGTANLNNFSTAERILKMGLSPTDPHVQFNGGPELGLSTGNPEGDGGDGEQASHWRADEKPHGGVYIGIMDPTIQRNRREVMTDNDQNAIDSFGYRISDTGTTPPPNDNFALAEVINGASGTVNGSNRFATRETGEPVNPSDTGGGASVWYIWTAPGTGQATFDTIGSTYDTTLAIYTGTSFPLTHLISNDDIDAADAPPPRNIQSRVIFNATAGITYRIQVDGYDADQGSIVLNWTAPGGATPTPSPTPGGPNTVQFSSSTGSATELDGSTAKAVLTVTRTGTVTGAATVNYATTDVTALERSDYLATLGTLRFAANETSKTITVFVVNDSFGEGPETFNITLGSPVGCTIGSPAASVVTINSDEAVNGPNPVANASFSSDNFVRQHYADFFNREADPDGLNFWKNQIDECTTDDCRKIRRSNVSAAFFVSGEFQQTGYLVYKAYQAAFNSGEFLKLRDFLPDTQEIGRGVVIGAPGAEAQLEANKVAFFNDFVLRPTFVATANYPTTMTAVAFVEKLDANTLDPRNTGSGGALTPDQRNALVAELTPNPSSPALRASVLRQVAQNSLFSTRQSNKAFVLMQYFGYLRRNPNDPPEFGLDFGGYNFWLDKLNNFNGNYIAAQMVEAFITAGEYKLRFGPN